MESHNLPLIEDNLNYHDLELIGKYIPELNKILLRFRVGNYDSFIKLLYDDIDMIIAKKQENPELYYNDSEDRTTIDIVNQLSCLGYTTSHDTKRGGHVDILVNKGVYTWIGEAKIYRGCEYIWQGFLQLITRYSTGDYNQRDGGLLIYINNHPDAKSIMDEWKKHLSEKKLIDYEDNICLIRPLSFFSSHKHDKSGQPFKVRHMPIMLYFAPKDKKTRKKKTT